MKRSIGWLRHLVAPVAFLAAMGCGQDQGSNPMGAQMDEPDRAAKPTNSGGNGGGSNGGSTTSTGTYNCDPSYHETAYGGSLTEPAGNARWYFYTRYSVGSPITEPFTAGQHLPVGTVSVRDDGESLYVTYATTAGWVMNVTHATVAAALDSVPGLDNAGNGAPINGQFKSQATHNPAVTSYTYTFPLASYAGATPLAVFTHAEVVNADSSAKYCGTGDDTGGDTEITGITGDDPPVPPAPTFSLNGRLFFDTDKDAQLDSNESGLGGITVVLVGKDGNIAATTLTDATGAYTFPGVPAGESTVSAVPGQGFGLNSTTVTSRAATVTAADVAGLDFGYALPRIAGNQFWDLDKDGLLDTTDQPLGDTQIRVSLVDQSGNVAATTQVGADGSYTLEVLPGTYTVRSDIDGLLANLGSTTGNSQGVSVPLANVAAPDFGYALPRATGDLFWDLDKDGVLDTADRPLGDTQIRVSLMDQAGNAVATTQVGADGSYTFEILPGNYTVRSDIDGLLRQLGCTTGNGLAVAVAYAPASAPDFGYLRPRLGNTVFFDIDGDGTQNADEPGLQGVQVTLNTSTSTSANGSYSFEVLPGTYTVGVAVPNGLTPNAPTSVSITVQYADIENVDFPMSLPLRSLVGQSANGFTIGYWKNNLDKAINGATKGVQVGATTLNNYTARIASFSLEPFAGISKQGAVAVLSSTSSAPVNLLAKQLIASQYNYMNGAFLNGNELVTRLFIIQGEYLVKHASDYSAAALLQAKDLFDAYNNTHGGALLYSGTI